MNRNEFLKHFSLFSLSMITDLSSFAVQFQSNKPAEIMPVLFLGHGSPMNAITDNAFTQHLQQLGKSIDKPKAILVISAHWYTKGTFVSSTPNPKTIYDFYGFPQELSTVKYPAPGSPEGAKMVQENVKSLQVFADHEMGFDHGAWSVMRHVYPQADIPMFQMSIDYTKPPAWHYKLAGELAALRKKGVLIVGSGNIVHNLGKLDWSNGKPFDWSVEFDSTVKKLLISREHEKLIDYQKLGTAAMLSVPTNDHYLPMIYALGLQQKSDELTFTYEGIEYGSISMRCFAVGK